MKLRARLMLAFLLLAVIPLAGLVTFSYVSSRRAFRRAVESEAQTQAEAMSRRLGAVRSALDAGLGEAAREAVIADESAADDEGRHARLLASLRQAMGPAAPLVQSFEWVPVEPAREAPPGDTEPAAPPAAPAPHVAHLVLPNPLPETADDRMAGRSAERSAEAPLPRSGIDVQEIIHQAMEQAEAARQQAAERMERLSAAQRQEAAHQLRAAGLATQEISDEELQRLDEARRASEALLGQELSRAVERDGQVVGRLRVQVRARQLLHGVLAAARRAEGEIPFAVDHQGTLYTVDPADEEALAGLPLAGDGTTTGPGGKWVLSRTRDAASGIVFGIARPVGEELAVIGRTAARNLVLGLAFIGLAALGIVPVSRRMTRNLGVLTDAAAALGEGDLEVRVPVRSADEIGQLAATFNHMAGEIRHHQRLLLEEERRRGEQEVEHRLLEAENERKSHELEEARRFQLALLPSRLPDHPEVEVAVSMRTATEVGGDYYDFRVSEDGALVVAIGDATGHGATAGTMVTMIKGLFTVSGDPQPRHFLEQAAGAIRNMNLGRMNMALSLVRIHEGRLVLSAAGMPPLLLYRPATGGVEEVTVQGMPLGGLAGATYRQVEVSLAPGDTALLMSDGFPELIDAAGEPLGYERARRLFAAAAAAEPSAIVARLEADAERWRGGGAPNDDITFVVLRARTASP